MKISRISWGVLFCCMPVLAQSTTAPAPPTPPAFIIGVWQQPPENFAAWQEYGINTLVEIPTPASAHPQAPWVAAAEAAGLWQIRVPVGALATDDKTPHLLAWNQPDEPEGTGVPAATCAANYAAWKAVNPKRPVCLNFDGSRVLGIQGGLTQANYKPYLSCADWFGNDFYPVTCWGRPDWIDHPGLAVSTLAGWTGSKPQIAFIECSNQRIGPSQLATTAQIRYEVWHCVICGASGICWFPEQFNPFNFDGTTPAIQAEMTSLDAQLTAVGPYLAGARQISVVAGFDCITNTVGGFTMIVNKSDAVANYSGVAVAPYGCYAIANGKVIVQTPLPFSADQLVDQNVNQQAAFAALQAQQAADHATIVSLSATVANLTKTTQPNP
jgi:hypothetical protein